MVKIKVSFTEQSEKEEILEIMKPILYRFKVKESKGTPPFFLLFFNPKSAKKPRKKRENH